MTIGAQNARMTRHLSKALYALVALTLALATAWALSEPQQQPNRPDFGQWR